MSFIDVNQSPVDLRNAILLSNFRGGDFVRQAIDDVLVRQHAEKAGIRNSDEELQVAADEFRYMRGLESVDDLNRWVEKNHLTLEAVQDGIELMLLRNKSAYAIPADDVRAYFAEHQLEFERVELYSIRSDNEEKAKEIAELAREDAAAFHSLAMEHSTDDRTRPAGGYVGSVARHEVTGVIEAAVFSAAAGTVIGPVKTDNGWNVFKVGEITRPDFAAQEARIRETLFDRLMDKLRSEAKISLKLPD